MKIKKVPERTCIVTHDKCMKKDLLRVVRCPDGTVKVDLTGKMNGRGAYICPKSSCLEKAIKSRGLERSFKMPIPKEVYEMLAKEMGELETR